MCSAPEDGLDPSLLTFKRIGQASRAWLSAWRLPSQCLNVPQEGRLCDLVVFFRTNFVLLFQQTFYVRATLFYTCRAVLHDKRRFWSESFLTRLVSDRQKHSLTLLFVDTHSRTLFVHYKSKRSESTLEGLATQGCAFSLAYRRQSHIYGQVQDSKICTRADRSRHCHQVPWITVQTPSQGDDANPTSHDALDDSTCCRIVISHVSAGYNLRLLQDATTRGTL